MAKIVSPYGVYDQGFYMIPDVIFCFKSCLLFLQADKKTQLQIKKI